MKGGKWNEEELLREDKIIKCKFALIASEFERVFVAFVVAAVANQKITIFRLHSIPQKHAQRFVDRFSKIRRVSIIRLPLLAC